MRNVRAGGAVFELSSILPAQEPAEAPQARQTDHQNRVARRVVPILDRLEAVLGPEINEQKRADEVAKEGEERAGDDQDDAAQNREPIEFSEENRDHEGGLQRADAGAGFIDPDKTGADFDDVAHLHGWDADRGEELRR